MNNEFILQSLTEAFEIIKDSWSTKKEAIINCIVETEVQDGSLAMEMWCYILQKNELLLKNKDENEHLINDVFYRFYNKYERFGNKEYVCRTILDHIIPHMEHNEQLIKTIFGKAMNAGFECGGIFGEYFIPICIAGIILSDNPYIVRVLIESLTHNPLMKDVSAGQLLIKANGFIEIIRKKEEYFDKSYSVSLRVKETLLSCLDMITDQAIRAECTIAFISY